jgi:hypothetical protein
VDLGSDDPGKWFNILIGHADDLERVAASFAHREAFTDDVARQAAIELRRIAVDLQRLGEALKASAPKGKRAL